MKGLGNTILDPFHHLFFYSLFLSKSHSYLTGGPLSGARRPAVAADGVYLTIALRDGAFLFRNDGLVGKGYRLTLLSYICIGGMA